MKYIIKNCPNYDECGCRCTTDCLLKQIVEKCNQIPKIIDGNSEKLPAFELGVKFRNKTILDLLEIEECKNENH